MADGTPDFADLLAAFDDVPVVTLHQISSRLGSTFTPANPSLGQQNQTVGAPEHQLGQIAGINQSTDFQSQAFIEPDVIQAPEQVQDAYGGGGSLGSMFLSSVESMLSETGGLLGAPLVPQPTAQPKPSQRKARPPRPKPNNVQQRLPQNRALQSPNVAFANIAPAATVEASIPVQNTNILRMKVPGSAFGVGMEIQHGSAVPPVAAQQKIHQGQFIQRTQGTRQQPQSSNPPRPLSAASSTSEHLSHPGSVPQPSPSCGSNHSGDPATPLTPQSYNAGTPQSYNAGTPQSYNAGTPQSYNAGTPQSYNAGTPQSYNAGTPQSYNAATPQSYKPATPLQIYPVSGQSHRQRNTGFGDSHQQQQISASMNTGALESFGVNQRTNLPFRAQPSPMHPVSTTNESLNDLPSPLKEAFITTNNPGPFNSLPNPANNSQLWNPTPAVMAPSALFTSTAQSKDPTGAHFHSSNMQMNFGCPTDIYSMQMQLPFAQQRQESNAKSETLTSKQNELLDQMALIAKTKKPPQTQNLGLDSGLASTSIAKYTDIEKSDATLSTQSGGSSTMSMMNKANDAGSAAVKELLGTPYEAISPVSDYTMSPVHKSGLHDDLSETIGFSPSKFSSQSALSMPLDSNPMTDPVLMYLKHDDGKTTSKNNNSNSVPMPDINPGLSEIHHTWISQSPVARVVSSNDIPSQHFSSSVPVESTANTFSNEGNHSSSVMQGSVWNTSAPAVNKGMMYPLPVSQSNSSSQISNQQSYGGPKNLQSSPVKQRSQPSPPVSKNYDMTFGIARRKASADRSKQPGLSKRKKTASIDSNFGFESDDETEPTICLSKATPKAKKSQKALQPTPVPPKARVLTNFASKDITDKMEHLKQLHKQQQMMLQLQRARAQQGTSLQASNATVSMHLNAHPAKAKTSQHLESFRRPLVEKSDESFAVQPSPNLTMSFSRPSVKTPPHGSVRISSLDFPTPLSLAQPAVSTRFGELSKAHLLAPNMPATLASLSDSETLLSSSNGQISNFTGFVSTPATMPAALYQSGLPFTSGHSLYSTHHVPPGNTAASAETFDILSQRPTSSTHSLPVPTLATESLASAPRIAVQPFASDYRATTSTCIPMQPCSNSAGSDLACIPPALATATPSSGRPQLFDNQFNLDWLHREPEAILSGKFKTPESASEVANSSPRHIPLPVTVVNPELAASSSSVVLKDRPNILPEDEIMPLKQSIHTVHHSKVTKSLPTMAANTTVVTKESTPVFSETKHLNFKKHRILEGYPKENYKLTFNGKNTASTQSITSAPQSVLDKQRRYSKERNSVKPRHRVQHQVTESPKLPVKSVSHSVVTPAPPVTGAGASVAPNKNKPPGDQPKPGSLSSEEKKDKPKDDQGGNMLLLFNSLLQEATEFARKNPPGAKQDAKATKEDESKVPSPAQDTSEPPITASEVPKDTPLQASLPVSHAVATSIEQTVIHQSTPVSKKPAKKSRPAATVPFKRRPYPAFDDTAMFSMFSNPVSSAVSVSQSTVAVSSTAPTSSSVSTMSFCTTFLTTSVSVPPQSALPVASTSVVNSSVTRVTAALPTPSTTPEKTPETSSALPKLRITLFRSSKGKVIHQSAMISGGNDTETVDSEGSSHRKHRKKKKRKREKSYSDNSSVSSKSSAIDETTKLAQEAKLNEQITKELEKKAQSILKSVEASTTIGDLPSEVIVPVNEVEEIPTKPQRRKRTRQSAVDIAEVKKTAKRTKVSKPSAKKKLVAKTDEPIVRYQPKSVLQASSVTATSTSVKISVSLPSSFRRAPGKRPLYLNTSEAKSTAVPTIQLVARNTKLLGSGAEQKTSTASTKVLSVKITGSLPNKSLPTQVLPTPGVHYIIPSTRSQQRVLLPNISSSTPVTVPVSIVSPRFARSFSGGFVPVSMCALTSTQSVSTKPQLFSVPLSHSDGVATAIKLTASRQLDVSKSQKMDASARKITITSQASSETFKLSATQNSKVTVTRTLSAPRVTTKIISPAAATQRTSNVFQSTFLKLISSQNPVSTYEPPSPPSDLEIDAKTKKQFQCLECKDTFTFSKTLDDHYKRRCILIKVRCMQCDKDLVFLNKCKLLLHARQHSEKGGNGMQFNNAHISPLPSSLCKPLSKESYLSMDESSSAAEKRSEDEISNLSAGMPASFPTVLACTDCQFIGSTAEALEEHFQRVAPSASSDKSSGAKPAMNFACELCSVSVPNQCSFLAHMRMHKRATPHTCPECGQTFDNDGLQEHAYSENRREIDFNLHLSVQCFHLSRLSAYKCRICNSIFKNAELLRRHLEVRHLQTFYKCRDCPMAFKTQENIASHQRSAHGVVAVTKMIHKCPLCDTVFTDNSPTQQLFLLQKHFEGHMSHPSINITAYKCLFCNNIYERKALLRDHLKSVHDVVASGDGSGDGGELSKDLDATGSVGIEEKPEGAKKRSLLGSTWKEPLRKIPRLLSPDAAAITAANNLLIASGILGNKDEVASESPMVVKNTMQPLKLRLKGMSAHPANGTPSSDMLMDSHTDMTSANLRVIIKDGRKFYPCGECSKEHSSASARLNHIKLKHKGIRTMFCCPHCPPGKIQFAKKISLKNHLKKVHQIEDMKKQDVLTEYVKLPVGQRFDPMTLHSENDDSREDQQSPRVVSHSVKNKVRKKITGLGRRLNRPIRQVRRDLENGSPYVENSDSEVEQIMSHNRAEDSATERSDIEDPDFSLLKLPKSYTCANCDFECNDRLEFQAHIVEHREDTECEGILNTMQQCTECGLRFASVASHTKHLFIKHKIKRKKLLDLYDRQLKAERAACGSLPGLLSGDAAASGRSTLGSDKKKHKCSVCFKRFEDDGRLRTHMRTHGLAFVKSKHAS